MAEMGAFRSTTFKPTIDKWIAKDGVPVVLWNDGEELLLLRFANREWTISTHAAADATGRLYRGSRYQSDGPILLRLAESASDAEWSAVYEEYFEQQKLRLRGWLNETIGGMAAMS